jgi:hypothetical protein
MRERWYSFTYLYPSCQMEVSGQLHNLIYPWAKSHWSPIIDRRNGGLKDCLDSVEKRTSLTLAENKFSKF